MIYLQNSFTQCDYPAHLFPVNDNSTSYRAGSDTIRPDKWHILREIFSEGNPRSTLETDNL